MHWWLAGNYISFILSLIVNYLGGTGQINHMSQQAVSNKYLTLITPAGFTFSIWGVIYSLILITLIYLIFKREDKRVIRTIQVISPFFILSCILNMAWIVSFSYEFIGLSVILIFLLLLTLMKLIEMINNQRDFISYRLPGITFTLYASWVLIATIVNIASLLVKIGWNGFGISPSIWTLIIITIAIIFVVVYVVKFRNAVFPIASAWAFYGIYSEYENEVYAPEFASLIMLVLLIGLGIFVLTAVYCFIKNENGIFPKSHEKAISE
ncbi:tryptophan-rich sensory protein [Facklamia miroungae]|nr:tryptophan-rich sensory protein [Facklamia miroungae]